LLTDRGCIILGETLQPADIGTIRANWWYVAPRNGHVSTFADRTLAALAAQLGLIFHRGTGHHALRSPGEGPHARIAERFGRPIACFRLRAPAEEVAGGFHAIEGIAGQRFRWSGAETLLWRIQVPFPRRTVQIAIPYRHEARHGFAAGCRVDIGDRAASVSVRESAIVAEADDVMPGPTQITLYTPELFQPKNDPRQLGLAIEVVTTVETGKTSAERSC
jgi:hypothetical protein